MFAISLSIIKLSLIALLGGCLYRRNFIKEDALRFLTRFVVNITVPCLIFSRLIENSGIVVSRPLWLFIILSVVIFAVGYLAGVLTSFKDSPFKKEYRSLVSMQNGGYLPMNIGLFLFTSAVKDEFLTYVFLYLLGFHIIVWSVGSFFIFKKKEEKFKWGSVWTPPVISLIAALILIYTNSARFIPAAIISPLGIIGNVSFVLSMIVLGCWLAKASLKGASKSFYLIGKACFTKLIILPLLFLSVTAVFKIYSLLGLFIVLQAAMPSAASLPIIADLRKADSAFISQGVFFTHILSIFTIPLWLGLYLKISGLAL